MEQKLQEELVSKGFAHIYGPADILTNMALAFAIGLLVSFTYKVTHKGLSYSQSFMLTLVLMTPIVAMVMMIIGNSLARAFALVGALSIIRFRTVVKDTKDTTFVFLALAVGMASGTSSYFLAIGGAVFISAVAFILHSTNYGSFYKSEFILRFRSENSAGEPGYSSVLNKNAKTSNVLHMEPSGDGKTTLLTFDIVLKKDIDPTIFSSEISAVENVSEVALVASKHDADY